MQNRFKTVNLQRISKKQFKNKTLICIYRFMNELLTFFSETGLIDTDGITTNDLKEALFEVTVTAVSFAIVAFLFCLLLANI